LEFLAVEQFYGLLGFFGRGHFDEGKAAGLRWTPKTRPLVKMDFRWSAGKEKADYESKTQTA
jgi:hypothetical protein